MVAGALHEGQELWRARPTVKLMGKRADGTFRTAAAKEYSSALCRSLVVALVQGLRRRAEAEGFRGPIQPSATAEQWLMTAWNAAHQVTRQSFLPDYQGT